MAMNSNLSHSSLLNERYRREMEIIDAALQEEGQDEREDRLIFVERAWPLACACFQGQLESADAPVSVPATVVRP